MTTIRAFTEELVNKWCLGQPRYINRKRICKDIRRQLRMFDRVVWQAVNGGKKVTDRELMEIVADVQSILVVIQPEYTGDGGRTLDMRIDEMDLEVQSLIEEFFNRRYNLKVLV